jgi:hypothetical protein
MSEKPEKIDNTPGLQWRGKPGQWIAIWVCSNAGRKRDYPIKTHRLWPPSTDPRAPLTEDVKKYLQSECTRLQDELFTFLHGDVRDPLAFDGTLHGLIECYQRDPDSPFQNLRHKSRQYYICLCNLIDGQYGRSDVAAIKGRIFKRWYDQWSQPKEPGGKSRKPIALAKITMLRNLFSFGASVLEDSECARVREVLRILTFSNPRPRRQELTREHAQAICAEAHRQGFPSIALAQALSFELLLRPKDVIGDYVPMHEPGISDVFAYGEKWLYGLDWREVSPTLILTHRLSKSMRGRQAILDPNEGKEKRFDLRQYPMVLAELERIAPEHRSGPMVIDERARLPWRQETFRDRWRQIANAAGVPADVQYRDSRAGGITEGLEASGGDIEMLRHSAGHSNRKTTERYARGDDRQTLNLAKLRAERAKNSVERPQNKRSNDSNANQ